MEQQPNRLINEASPYLQQHAYNPVDWYPWCDEAFEKAKRENKLVLLSIGYSSCHWCHVMENESFSDVEVAGLMNKYFVSIKVDREERPDIDMVYMNAVTLMNGQGGWPLNCFILPDGKPIYGATYFPKENWKQVLEQLHILFEGEKEKVLEYAEKLTHGIRLNDLIRIPASKSAPDTEVVERMVERWKEKFDPNEGGPNRAPKFPLPDNYLFLLQYAHLTNDAAVTNHVKLTLDKMAMGGIHDQVGGGFSRYSTDIIWKVPHFEKMLYDNAQLLSLYAQAYQKFQSPLYRETAEGIYDFLTREMESETGGFYSALDADTSGEEGGYYVWTKEELLLLFGEEVNLVCEYYQVNYHGEWGPGRYILLRRETDEHFAKRHGWTTEYFLEWKARINTILLEARMLRDKPLRDDKMLTGWNALVISGMADAYKAIGDEKFREKALQTGHFIMRELLKSDGGLFHSFQNNESRINGFADDYALTIHAFLDLYEITCDERWLERAEHLMTYSIGHFSDEERIFFYYTSSEDKALIVRKTELHDDVTPSSNSVFVKALFVLSIHLDKEEWKDRAERMLQTIAPHIISYGPAWSNWASVLCWFRFPFYEVVITGESMEQEQNELFRKFLPQAIFAGATSESELPLLKSRFIKDQTSIYVCRNNSCNLPVHSAVDALNLMK